MGGGSCKMERSSTLSARRSRSRVTPSAWAASSISSPGSAFAPGTGSGRCICMLWPSRKSPASSAGVPTTKINSGQLHPVCANLAATFDPNFGYTNNGKPREPSPEAAPHSSTPARREKESSPPRPCFARNTSCLRSPVSWKYKWFSLQTFGKNGQSMFDLFNLWSFRCPSDQKLGSVLSQYSSSLCLGVPPISNIKTSLDVKLVITKWNS
mmetsp:Transcript_36789/g.67446  ORF Transcript_36789/g.67446 Transcript_36789/m.67446 type:complete len:211 (+) Transcript_36789:645-1277(+)